MKFGIRLAEWELDSRCALIYYLVSGKSGHGAKDYFAIWRKAAPFQIFRIFRRFKREINSGATTAPDRLVVSVVVAGSTDKPQPWAGAAWVRPRDAIHTVQGLPLAAIVHGSESIKN